MQTWTFNCFEFGRELASSYFNDPKGKQKPLNLVLNQAALIYKACYTE